MGIGNRPTFWNSFKRSLGFSNDPFAADVYDDISPNLRPDAPGEPWTFESFTEFLALNPDFAEVFKQQGHTIENFLEEAKALRLEKLAKMRACKCGYCYGCTFGVPAQ